MEIIHSLLLKAIEGESGAEAQYKAFARRAMEEGYPGVASLCTALARAEAIHSANHIRALEKNGFTGYVPKSMPPGEIASTRRNLEKAVKAEYDEYRRMYPSFRRQINKRYGDDFTAKIALLSIKWASESEANHHDLLKRAMEAVDGGEDITGGDFYLCGVCGNIIFSGKAPEKPCEVCGHDISFYTLVRMEHERV